MKTKRILWGVASVVLVAVVCGVVWWCAFHRIPSSLSSFPGREGFLQHLDAEAARGATWTQHPVQVALALTRFGCSDPFENPASIRVAQAGPSRAVVMIHEWGCHDDSTAETYSVIRLRRDEAATWRPTAYAGCRKGRGHWGWTTEPTH